MSCNVSLAEAPVTFNADVQGDAGCWTDPPFLW